jgi:hypothetical protein
MLGLKLSLVPACLLFVSLASKRWGPGVAGWLASLPIIAGPVVLFLTLANGPVFGTAAAKGSMAAVFASVSFGAVYVYIGARRSWPIALAGALLAWGVAAALTATLFTSDLASLLVALATLMLAPRVFPPKVDKPAASVITHRELLLRMGAGVLLVLVVTGGADLVGPRWSGLLAVFPVMASILAVFSHRNQGLDASTAMLRGLATGLYAFVAFFLVLSLTLTKAGTLAAFGLALLTALVVHAAGRRHLL